jgi:hypothetical protein
MDKLNKNKLNKQILMFNKKLIKELKTIKLK